MSPTPATGRASRARLGTLAAAAATLLIAGCGAGQVASTTSQVAAVNGAAGSKAQLEIRNAELVYPTDESPSWQVGADVPMTFTAVNEAGEADTLTSVTSSAAKQVTVSGTTTIPSRAAVVGVDDADASAAQADSAQAAQNSNSETPALNAGEVRVELTGLTRTITAGETVAVTFTFAKAGEITLPVPIASPTEPRKTETQTTP